MKLSISNLAWDKSGNNQVADLMQKYGFTGVEIAPGKVFDSPADATTGEIHSHAKYWNDKGIKVSAIQAFLFGHRELTIFDSPEVRKQTLDYIDHMIDFAGDLGAEVLVFGSPKNRLIGDMDQDEALKIAQDFFYELGEKAKSRDCYFCLEPNARDYGADFMIDTDETLTILNLINHPNIMLNLDAGIMVMNGEDPVSSITKSSKYLRHFHASEPQLAPVGEGEVDNTTDARALRDAGYEHWVSIEMRQPAENGMELIEAALKKIKEAYGD